MTITILFIIWTDSHYPSECLSLHLCYILCLTRIFFQYKITVPDTGKVEIDESFGFEPYLHKVRDNFNVSLCVCTTVQTYRHEEFLSWTHQFWVLQPHLKPWSSCYTNLQ